MTTIIVTTTPDSNASSIGEAYGYIDGVAWRNSVDRCFDDGCGRVFLDCESPDVVDCVQTLLDNDEQVQDYRIQPNT